VRVVASDSLPCRNPLAREAYATTSGGDADNSRAPEVDAPSKLPFSAQHGYGHEAVVLDAADVFLERTAVANTRCAAVADKLEAQLVKISSETSASR